MRFTASLSLKYFKLETALLCKVFNILRYPQDSQQMEEKWKKLSAYLSATICKRQVNELLKFPNLEDILISVYKYRTYGKANHLHHQCLSARTFSTLLAANMVYRSTATVHKWHEHAEMWYLNYHIFKDRVQALLFILKYYISSYLTPDHACGHISIWNFNFKRERAEVVWKKKGQIYEIAPSYFGWASVLGNDIDNFLSWITLLYLNKVTFLMEWKFFYKTKSHIR